MWLSGTASAASGEPELQVTRDMKKQIQDLDKRIGKIDVSCHFVSGKAFSSESSDSLAVPDEHPVFFDTCMSKRGSACHCLIASVSQAFRQGGTRSARRRPEAKEGGFKKQKMRWVYVALGLILELALPIPGIITAK